MCELFGFLGAHPQKLNHELAEFFSHSKEHPNGWGLSIIDGPTVGIEREPQRAVDSNYLASRLASDIVATTALAHIRRSTIGADRYDNCHPFIGVDSTGRTWSLIHNGTVFNNDLLARYSALQNGTTDSERILLHLIDSINQETEARGRELTSDERFAVVDALILEFGPENKINLLIFDGELLYSHVNCEGTLHVRRGEDYVMISTEPLAVGTWEKAPFLQLVAYDKDGLSFEGTRHNNEYFLDQKRLDQVLSAYRYL